jgi:hypothetical protein
VQLEAPYPLHHRGDSLDRGDCVVDISTVKRNFTQDMTEAQSRVRSLQSCDYNCYLDTRYLLEVKAKAVSLHAIEAQGERIYSSYSFTTSALEGG